MRPLIVFTSEQMPKTVEEAQAIIDKFEGAANRPDEHVPDNVCHHSQAGVLPLSEARWAATEEEERDAYVRAMHARRQCGFMT